LLAAFLLIEAVISELSLKKLALKEISFWAVVLNDSESSWQNLRQRSKQILIRARNNGGTRFCSGGH
jgi:hypothetical protein